MLVQVGVLASSKSAMKTLAPQFSALMIILRSTGPVISTRRSRMSMRQRRDRPVAVADRRGLGQEIGLLAGIQPLLALDPGLQEFLPPAVEAALQAGHEGHRLPGEHLFEAGADNALDRNTVG